MEKIELSPYDTDLDKNPANYVPLSPLSFLSRTASLFPNKLAWVDGEQSCTWRDMSRRCHRLSSSLASKGIQRGDTVSTLMPNSYAMFEAHFGIPATGAVINTLNIRLDAVMIAFMLDHSECKALIVDYEFTSLAKEAIQLMRGQRPIVIEATQPNQSACSLGDVSYEDFLTQGDDHWKDSLPLDEWDAIALNYTSGTTGNPKGVVVHHRGAYLNAISNAVSAEMKHHPVYLWTLPMFHCNGWCFPWTLAMLGGTSVCLRKVEPDTIVSLIQRHAVTHMCGAPIVYNTMLSAAENHPALSPRVTGLCGGASPPAALLEGCEQWGIDIVHVYGLTEVYGPSALCVPQDGWESQPLETRAKLLSRQGVATNLQEGMTVLAPDDMSPVPWDGKTMGELYFRGNIVMKGYLKNKEATQRAFKDGWFHTGDLAVVEPDGYAHILDRSKDIIISGGENISSIEVEDTLYRHPDVTHAAVVAMQDKKWGEVPCAFVEVKDGIEPSENSIIQFCRDRLAHFKAPKKVIFGELPKTATGKIQKFELRQRLR